MKVCPKCFLHYEDVENFCFNDGTTLDVLSDSQEQVTVTIPIGSNQTVKCRNCETENKVNSKFCKKCGITMAADEPIFIQLQNSSQNQQETVVISTTPKVEPPNLTAYPPLSQNPIIQTDNTIKYIVGGLGVLIVLIFFGVFLYPPDNSATSKNKKSENQNSDSEQSSANSSSAKSSALIGKIGYLQMNANLRSCPDTGCPSLGIHFENAKIKILDVQDKVNGNTWYKVQVVEYGCHTLNKDWCGKQFALDKFDSERTYPLDSDKSAQDTGWVLSYSKTFGRDVVRF